jgi:glycosyltransferase involved in cell wall biosynthesis
MNVVVYHNLLWPKYKGAIFSRMFALSTARGVHVEFVQIAETLAPYARLGPVDLSYHRYPYRLLIKGDYGNASLLTIIWRTGSDLWRRRRCDLVVLPGYEAPQYWLMLALCMLLGRRRAVFCDSTALDSPRVRIREFAKRLFFSRCDGIFCYGTRSMEYIRGYGVPPARIYFPCQAAALPHDYSADAVRAAYIDAAADGGAAAGGDAAADGDAASDGDAADNDGAAASRGAAAAFTDPQFIYFGRLSAEKGIDDLLQALRLVRARMPGARLDLVGAGPLEGLLRARVVELGLADAVVLHRARPLAELVPMLYRSVAMVVPSHREPWGLVVNESLSYGCPVVVSDRCGCVPELVIEGVTGYSYPCGNIERLSEAMLAVVRLSTDRPATASRCLALMAGYTPEQAAARILSGCMQMLGRPA